MTDRPTMTDPKPAGGGLCLFVTAVGRCGIAWRGGTLLATALPEAGDAATLARLRRRAPDADEAKPPASIGAIIGRIVALVAGGRESLARDALAPDLLADIEIDMDGVPPFDRAVYAVARGIPPGRTLTYGDVARRIGGVAESRAVGAALGRNPFPIVVPCHRVVAAGGRTGGFSAEGGVATKLKLLALEGAEAGAQRDLFR